MLFVPNKVSNQPSTYELPLLNYSSMIPNSKQNTNEYYYSYGGNDNHSETNEPISFVSLATNYINLANNKSNDTLRKPSPQEVFNMATFKMKRRKSSSISYLHKLL